MILRFEVPGEPRGPRPLVNSIYIPIVPPSLNQYMRSHWAVKKKMRQRMAWAIRLALVDAGYRDAWYTDAKGNLSAVGHLEPAPKMNLLITVHSRGARKRRLDKDNLWGGCKPLFDAMRDIRFIRNDTPKWLDAVVVEDRDEEEIGTTIDFEAAETDRKS